MAKIICVTTGLTGILNASVELINRLKKSGHEVSYASHRNVKEKVEQEGIKFTQLPDIHLDASPELPSFQGPFKKIKRLIFKIINSKQRRIVALEKTIPDGFEAMLQKEKPDLVIIDIELHEYIFKAYSKGQNFILLSQWFSLWKRKGLPYLLHDTIPQEGWSGHPIAISFSWWKIQWQRWWIFLRKKILSGGTDRRSILLELAEKEGFPKSYIAENYWPGPFTYSQLPVISMTALEMEFPHDPRPNLFYVGPMVNEKRIEKTKRGSQNYTIEEVLDFRKKNGRALLYCSVSTLSKGDEIFIKKIITAVKNRKDWVLIIGMGGLIGEDIFKDLPKNVFPFSYVPQLSVLKEADISINHGGIHTINECVHFKVPMLIYSGKQSDQNGCAARVHYHGLGLMADKDLDKPEEIQRKINEVLTNHSFRKKVEEMHVQTLKYKNEFQLAKVIENSLSKKESIR